jgi:hypothetical protein
VDNDSGLSRFAFHIPPESDFSISRNPYSPFPGTPIHMPRIPHGKEIPIRDLAGLARSVQAGTSVPQGASFDLRDVQFLENKFIAIQADMTALLAQLAGAVPCTNDSGKQEQLRWADGQQ